MKLAKIKKLRIALLVDSIENSKYVYDIAKFCKWHDYIELDSLIIQDTEILNKNFFRKLSREIKKRGFKSLLNKIFFFIITMIEKEIIQRNLISKNHFQKFSLNELISNKIYTKPEVSKSGLIFSYDEKLIGEIKLRDIDLIIRFGSGILTGNILSVTKYGIISFHHGDNTINRGGPAGFWEVALNQATTGFTIQQLTEELDGGNVLYRGRTQTRSYYLLNQVNIYLKSNFYLKMLLNDIAKNKRLPDVIPSLPYFEKLYKSPNFFSQLNYIKNTLSKLIIKFIERYIFRKHYRWNVAFQYRNWRSLVMWKAIKIKNPPYHFLADPFVVSNGDKDYCFLEDYDYKKSKASIAVYEFKNNQAIRLGNVIEENFHLSYPYIFKYNSKYYMVPESSANRDIRVYEAVEFPMKWKFNKTLMSNISAADTTIFQKDQIWWLFTNVDTADLGNHCSELFIYYAENPLSSNWNAHPMNPIFCDSNKARMGGILKEKENIFRVSQQQGFDLYGKALQINKIVVLTKDSYQEETIHTVEPNFFEKILGVHHMHSNEKITAFDYLKKTKINF